MKPTKNYGLSDSLIDAVRKSVEEALIGGQKKLDVDKDGKLEKSDFASLRAKKDAVDTKPKLKEDHPDEKEDKALIKKLIKKADVSDDEEDKALIKKTMKKEEEQIDENELDEANRRGGNRFLNTREKDAIQKKMKPLDPNATVKYKDNYSITRGLPHEEQLKRHIHQATGHHVHISPTTHDMHDAATGAKIAHDAYNSGGAGQYGGPGGAKHTAKSLVHAVKKFHKEEYEQMDEAPLRAVNALVGYPKLYKEVPAKGTPGSEDERNKAAAGLKRDRRMGFAAYPGNQHYDVRREDVDHIDEKISVVRGDAPRQQGHSAPNDQTRIDKTPTGGRIFTGTYFTGTKKPSAAALAVQASARERLKKMREEYEMMDEVKLADLPRRKVVGKSYGADYVDPEGADETAADMKKAEPKRKSGPQGTMKRRFIKDKSKLRMQYK